MHLEIQDSASTKVGGLVPQARDADLVAFFGRAVGHEAARQLAESVGIETALSLDARELARTAGIPSKTAERFVAAREYTYRALGPRTVLSAPAMVLDALPEGFAFAETEMLFAFALDSNSAVKAGALIAKGGVSQAAILPRDLFVPILRAGASAFIVCHNHPGGDPVPSDADVALTNTISRIGYLLGVPLLDHVIVASRGTFSFSEAGLLLSDKELQATTMNLRASGGAS